MLPRPDAIEYHPSPPEQGPGTIRLSGNGVTLEAVYQLLGLVAADLRDFRRETKVEFARVDGRIDALHGEMQREFKDIPAALTGLRQVVGAYHATVLGHGILISELDDRVRRIERHLNLPCAV